MNFQPPELEDDPRDDDQRMQDAELESHRVRFEQYGYDDEYGKWSTRDEIDVATQSTAPKDIV